MKNKTALIPLVFAVVWTVCFIVLQNWKATQHDLISRICSAVLAVSNLIWLRIELREGRRIR